MESVDKLREFVKQADGWGMMHSHVQTINEIADAIEEEFKEQEVAHAFARSQVYDFASGIYGQLLNFDKMEEQQEAMAEHGYIKLPVDADGVPIRVGDWITGRWDAKAKVVAVTPDDVYWWEPDGCHWCHAFEVRHHHEPTVEDVLRELLDEAEHFHSLEEERDAIAEYAKKLRLAGDE